jgi:hypothetical protein
LAKKLILGGLSDGATWAHSYWRPTVDCLVHYAGLWRDIRAPRPCVVLCGQDDPLDRVRDACGRTAVEYGTIVHYLAGGHCWQASNNDLIETLVNQALYDGGVLCH